MSTVLDHAIEYARKGMRVFPCDPATKRPYTTHGFKDASTDERQIREWWAQNPDAMIGFHPGDKIVVIDVDLKEDGSSGYDTLKRLEAKYGKLPDTVCSQTPRGGRHFFFRTSGHAMRGPNGTNVFGPNSCVDIRGNGGYVILPPSARADGRQYEWIAAPDESTFADVPEWVLNEIGRNKPQHGPAEESSEVQEPIYEGSRDSQLTSIAGTLRRVGLGAEAIESALMDINAERCVPPLPDDQVSKIARSVCRYAPQPPSAKSKKVVQEDVERLLIDQGIGVLYNTLTGDLEVKGVPNGYSSENALNTLPIYLSDAFAKIGRSITPTRIADYLGAIADKNRYNPVDDLLMRVEWDHQDRLEDVYSILSLAPHDHQGRTYVRKWLHQCIALALNDESHPVGADGVLVLQGPQGCGKTLFARRIAMRPEWFAEGVQIDTKDKDCLIQATRPWIAELGEFDSTAKKEQTDLKAFITRAFDDIRKPYARSAVRRPRRTSFIATVNPAEFLRDDTGSRRWWVIHVNQIDRRRLLDLRPEWFEQLWAQVYSTLYLKDKNGFRLTDKEQKLLQQENEQYAMPLPGELELRDLLDFDMPEDNWPRLTTTELMQAMPRTCRITTNQLGRIVHKLAKEDNRVRITRPKNKVRYYLPLINPSFSQWGDADAL